MIRPAGARAHRTNRFGLHGVVLNRERRHWKVCRFPGHVRVQVFIDNVNHCAGLHRCTGGVIGSNAMPVVGHADSRPAR
jgi:hypothetical protein